MQPDAVLAFESTGKNWFRDTLPSEVTPYDWRCSSRAVRLAMLENHHAPPKLVCVGFGIAKAREAMAWNFPGQESGQTMQGLAADEREPIVGCRLDYVVRLPRPRVV